ncbi:glycosyltransferase [Bacteroidota bacterium]
MKLAVIIVNYNVKYFLEQCLHSAIKAISDIEAEIYVVDNNSVDGSCAMIREKFPQIILIDNKNNVGFSKANNQAIRLSKADYFLLLNPDTVVEEDTFKKIIEFADSKDDFGALGVKMIDGKGNFLPESKRGLPTPSVAFFKMLGFSKVFPKSRLFNRYYLGHLDPAEINKVDILAGAFMLLKKRVLDKVGLLDETFFMYGEDIDLSHRIGLGGFSNYYFPETTIIHYKGESTKKGSLNYVVVFYKAMIIFAKKHFSKKNARLFAFLISLAVYFTAGISILKRIIANIILPVLDMSMIFGGYYLIKPIWEAYKFPDGRTYPDEFLLIAVPAYILVWFLSILFSGGYSKPVNIVKIARGIGIGTIIIIIVYALLSEEMRFSRALIIIGAIWAFISILTVRLLFNILKVENFKIKAGSKKRIIIVGKHKEGSRVFDILNHTTINPVLVGFVYPDSKDSSTGFLGSIDQLREIVTINKVDEIIFCSKEIAIHEIIRNMLKLSDIQAEYKIAPPESISVIGSNSIKTSGDLYVININSIGSKSNLRNKRFLDVIISILLLLISPIMLLFYRKNFSGFFRNIMKIISGKLSWVGYNRDYSDTESNLPEIKKAVLSPTDNLENKNLSPDDIAKLNIRYARDYKIINDLILITKNIKYLYQ